jgi:hypothetical protein
MTNADEMTNRSALVRCLLIVAALVVVQAAVLAAMGQPLHLHLRHGADVDRRGERAGKFAAA